MFMKIYIQLHHFLQFLSLEGCEAGYEPSVSFTSCVPCLVGYYKVSLGFDYCVSCPEVVGYKGVLTPSKGSRSADYCYPVSI